MKLLIIFIVVMLFVSLYYLVKNRKEKFANYNLIDNGSFTDGANIGDNTDNDRFSVVNFENPSGSEHVLKQIKSVESMMNGYNIHANVETSQKYLLSLWKAVTSDFDGNSDENVSILSVGNSLSIKKGIYQTKKVGNIMWEQHIYIITTEAYNSIDITLGVNSKFSKGSRLYADITLRKFIDTLPDFTYFDGLASMIISNQTQGVNTIKSLTGKHDFHLKNKSLGGGIISLDGNSINISAADQMMKNKFTLVIGYHGKINESGYLFNAKSSNDINKGFSVKIVNTEGINNTLTIEMGIYKTIYNIGISAKLINIVVVADIDSNLVHLYLDGLKIEPDNTVVLSIDRPLGTCPDGYKFSQQDGDDITCYDAKDNTKTLKYNKKTDDKTKLSDDQGLIWTNCAELDINEIGPSNSTSCNVNTSLKFNSSPVEINTDETLTGGIKSFMFYQRTLDENEVVDLNRYLNNNYNNPNFSKKMFENVFNRPSLTDKPENTMPDCPFKDESICKHPDCQCVDWNNPVDVPENCKLKVNDHCRNNFTDPKCNNLREDKCKKKQENPVCEDSTKLNLLRDQLDEANKKIDSLKNVSYFNYKV